MLRVDVRRLGTGGVETTGSIGADDPLFEGLGFKLNRSVEVTGRLQATEGDDFLWHGCLRTSVVGECRRCLGRVEMEIEDQVDVLFSGDPDLIDDPSVYALPSDSATVDVSMAVKEELTLRTSIFPLCGYGCRGLCSSCGADLNAGPCECATPA